MLLAFRSVIAVLFRTSKLSLYIADKRSPHGWCEISDLSAKHVNEMKEGDYFKGALLAVVKSWYIINGLVNILVACKAVASIIIIFTYKYLFSPQKLSRTGFPVT